MHKTSDVKKKNLYRLFICANIFFSSCSSSRSESEAFLKKLLLEEGGVYTLLGDKPITDVLIYQGSDQEVSLKGLSAESLQRVEYIDDHTVENWKSWKNFSRDLKFNGFRFVERPCIRDPLHMMYLLVNIEKLRDLLQRYSDVFSAEIGEDVEVERVLNELDDPKSDFWNRAFANHHLSGLLHGYGEENCHHFMEVVTEKAIPVFSEKFEGPVTQENFPLPIFAASSDDAVTRKYQQQRKKIQEIYKRGNFFSTSVKLLQKKI